ncbi:MAG: 50S ribosomal protein L11 methyltransferase [Verrucomicrobiaceae bacterium]|nr:50S ribosomal protein L11 methyltransferase [Verrucomicrobiaceae bacterium]
MFVWSKLSASKWADAWEERFAGLADATPVITSFPGRDTVRVEVYAAAKKRVLAIQKEWGGSVRELKNQNWAAMAAKATPPLKVRDVFVVCTARTTAELARAHKDHPGREIIAIPAEMAFGTGHHETTSTVLRLLVDAAKPLRASKKPWSLADLGCGSGILAIAALKLGAARAWGCDYDPAAVRIAKENAVRNATPKARFTKTDVLAWQPREQWDIVAANIFHDVLEAAFPQITRAVAPGGLLILSGILHTQADSCLAAGKKAGFRATTIIRKGKWVTMAGRITPRC